MIVERVIFSEESRIGNHVRVVVSDQLDGRLLGALASYISRQRQFLLERQDEDELSRWEWG